jgi:hypothetical protein
VSSFLHYVAPSLVSGDYGTITPQYNNVNSKKNLFAKKFYCIFEKKTKMNKLKKNSSYIELMNNLPKCIMEDRIKLLDLDILQNQHKKNLTEIEKKCLLQINSKVDAQGKKIFSNENLRLAALDGVLKSNNEILMLQEQIENIDIQISKLKINIEFSYNLQKNVRAILNFEVE